jgi:polysaccharide deacetylase 2 family uncharacterized protein YibQ
MFGPRWIGPRNSGQQVVLPLPPAGALGGPKLVLAPAPDPALIEPSSDGPLPIVGKNGKQAWLAYARPFDNSEKRPRIAILITGLGLDAEMTKTAIDHLPGPVTLSFDPYSRELQEDITAARGAGHEVMLGLPMEPLDFPRQDPGPLTLLTSLDDKQNTDRLDKVMGAGVGYIGLTSLMGSRFTTSKAAMTPILAELKRRGLLFVDNRAGENGAAALARLMDLPWAVGDRVLDAEANQAVIDRVLAELETVAQRNHVALGIATLSPLMIDRVTNWSASLQDKELVLAPTSAVADRQPTDIATP